MPCRDCSNYLILLPMGSQEEIDQFKVAFGQRIKFLRQKYELTQDDLAERTEMDVRQIQRIEAGGH